MARRIIRYSKKLAKEYEDLFEDAQISPLYSTEVDAAVEEALKNKETYEEGWDSANNNEIPVPQQFIQPG